MMKLLQEEFNVSVGEHKLSVTHPDVEEKHTTELKNHYPKDDILYLREYGIIQTKDSFLHSDENITTEQFVTMMIRSSKGDIKPTRDDWSSGYIDYALFQGIIEDYDVTNRCNPIERRAAARMVHEALLTEFSESDEEEWKAADKLMDLYSCHTCVRHIAQVYVKGIMIGREDNLFDVNGKMTLSEAAAIIVRMLLREKRLPKYEDRVYQSKTLHPDEAREMMLNNKRTMLIDVRTKEEYKQGHMEGSNCIPLQDLSNNPYSVCARKDTPIILYCQKGYKSSIAAQVLIDAGYYNIYTIPGLEQYQYSLIL